MSTELLQGKLATEKTFRALAVRQSNSLDLISVPNLFLFGFFLFSVFFFSFLYDNDIAIRSILIYKRMHLEKETMRSAL